jgi:ABC-type multidrug transport system fused ATPase/permease subunit
MCVTSVERIKEYVDLPVEEKRPSRDDDWLQHGAIRFNKVTAKYKPHLPPAIQKISFTVKPGRRVGICGRSGSGKSTLLGVMWRLIHFEDDGGEITIDGIDIRDLPLGDYRSAMSIVPQGEFYVCELSGTDDKILCCWNYYYEITLIQRVYIPMQRSGMLWKRVTYVVLLISA